MNLEKILYTIYLVFSGIFILSAILIITNTLNMWLVGIVSLLICINCYISIKTIKSKRDK